MLAVLFLPAPSEIPATHDMGDREFNRMNYLQAVALYNSVLPKSPDSVVVLWRIARAWTCLADTSIPENKLALYKQALVFAHRAVRADSTNSEAHAWLAASYGNIAMFEGSKTKVRLCHVIKREIDLAIKLDSSDDVAYSILGSFYKALGDVSWVEKQLANVFLDGLPDGGYGEADVAFRTAIKLAPGVIRNHYELGKVYMCQDRRGEALTEFRKVLSLPVSVSVDREMQKSAGRFANGLEN
jgi:tetratricopeptide (TPR) repeat protein